MADQQQYIGQIEQILQQYIPMFQFAVAGQFSDAFDAISKTFGTILNQIFDYSLTSANSTDSYLPGIDLYDARNSVAVQITADNSRQKVIDTLDRFQPGRQGKRFDLLIILMVTDDPVPQRFHDRQDFILRLYNIPILLELIRRLPREKQKIILDRLRANETFESAENEGAIPIPPPDSDIPEVLRDKNGNPILIPSGTGLRTHFAGEQHVYDSPPSADAYVSPKQALDETDLPNAPDEADLTLLPPDRQQVLRCAAILPDEGLYRALFQQCLPEKQQRELFQLLRAGLLFQQDELLLISPALRRDCMEQLSPNDQNCADFLERLWKFDQTRFWKRRPLLLRQKVYPRLVQTFGKAADLPGDSEGAFSLRCAVFCAQSNQSAEELKWLLRAVHAFESAHPRDNGALAFAYYQTGSCYSRLNEHENALKYFSRISSLSGNVFALSSLDLGRVHHDIGRAHMGLKKYLAAVDHLQQALSYSENSLAPDHPRLAQINNDLNISFKELGLEEKSREYKLKSIRSGVSTRAEQQHSPILAQKLQQLKDAQARHFLFQGNRIPTLCSEIGDLYSTLGDYRKALEYHMQALEYWEKRAGSAPLALAAAYHNVGVIFSNLSDDASALEYMEKALKIRLHTAAAPAEDLLRSYLDMGELYHSTGALKSAMDFTQKGLAMQKKTLPGHSPLIANTYSILGHIARDMGQHESARDYYHQAFSQLSITLDKNHPDLAAPLMDLANAYIQLSRFSLALNRAEKALEIYRQTLPAGHPQLITTQNTVSWLKEQLQA